MTEDVTSGRYLSLRLAARGRTVHCVRARVDAAAVRCGISQSLADKLHLEGTAGHPVVTMNSNGVVVGSYRHAMVEELYWCPQEIKWVSVAIMAELDVDMVVNYATYNRLKGE